MTSFVIPIKQILWEGVEPPDKSCSYDHVRGSHPLGEVLISWKSWKNYPSYDLEFRDEYHSNHSTLEGAKETAQFHIDQLVLASIELN